VFATADHLIPFFKVGSTDSALARKMAISAIAAYDPETRADCINIARTIAFSMAALALLGKATSSDMTMPEQMRAYGRANTLNRSADQSERTMMRRRAYHKANPPAELPAWMNPGLETLEPEASIDDAEIQAAVAEAVREYQSHFTPAPTEAPPPEAAPARAADLRKTSSASPLSVVNAVQPLAATPTTAIRYNASKPGAGSFQKADLLHNSAMPRMTEQGIGRQTG
jgi:hypothetical protein